MDLPVTNVADAVDDWGGRGGRLDEPYACTLCHQPTHLLPQQLGRSMVHPDENDRDPVDLGLQEHCWLDAAVPICALDGISPSIHRDPWTLWVRDQRVGVHFPYLLDEECAAWVDSSSAGDPVLPRLSPESRRRLEWIGALGQPGDRGVTQDRWEGWIKTRESFRVNGFTTVDGLIHPFHVASLRARYRRLLRTNALQLGDNQCERRYVAHNEPVARYFHHQLVPAVSRLVGRPIKPSYAYLVDYEYGASLAPHTDRDQCEYSLSTCIDYAPDPAGHTPWPLLLHLTTHDVAVHQALGDSLLYRGRHIEHSRPPLQKGHTSVSLLFHYVDADFSGPID